MTKYKYFGKLCKVIDAFHVYNRNSEERWLECMSRKQLDWCVDNGFIIESSPMLRLGEVSYKRYYEFTKLGKELFDWYVYDTWFYFKYKVIRWHFWKYNVFKKIKFHFFSSVW